jgi:hypothetical protein
VAIDLEALKALEITDMRFAYGERETMLYAISIGMGRDPLDARQLPFVFEGAGLQAVPTMAVVLASTGIIRKTGVDFTKVLHGEQRLTLHRPLPVAGELLANSRVAAVYDKGAGKGAVLLLETTARSAADGAPLFTVVMTIVARGDGGFWRTTRLWPKTASASAEVPGPHRNVRCPPGGRAALPPERGSQSPACRSGRSGPRRICASDSPRARDLWNRLPRNSADRLRSRCRSGALVRCALLRAGLSRR